MRKTERRSVRKPTLVTGSEVGGPPIDLVLRKSDLNRGISSFVYVSQIFTLMPYDLPNLGLFICVYLFKKISNL